MGRVGLIRSEQLARNRKYAIVGIFAVAAILTPPDVISQIGLGVPILILYELSIIAVRIVEKRRAQAEAAEEAAERAAAGTELDASR
jgi:sec-independent protein translocase protein TatC